MEDQQEVLQQTLNFSALVVVNSCKMSSRSNVKKQDEAAVSPQE